MTKKNFANLNLNQSLKDFQASITQLLKLNNITEWVNEKRCGQKGRVVSVYNTITSSTS